MKLPNILITCGGSGGHIFPGIALAEALTDLNKNCRIFIVTSDRYIDTKIFEDIGYSYSVLPYNPLPDKPGPLKIFKFLLNLVKAVFRSFIVLKLHRPHCVVGMGGYVSGPMAFAAWLMRKRILIHEQNILPSLTNRLSAVFADIVCVTFEETKNYFKNKPVIKTGNPVRSNFLKDNTSYPSGALGFENGKFTILIMGGSQGSSFLNDSARSAISQIGKRLRKGLRVLHITGKKDYTCVKKDYEKMDVEAKIFPFLDKIGYAYNAADLIISRAGATALSEMTFFGKPSILIPHPKARVHQKENAEFFASRGAGICIEEKDLSPVYLKDVVLSLMEDTSRLRQMGGRAKVLSNPDAAYKLARETLDLLMTND